MLVPPPPPPPREEVGARLEAFPFASDSLVTEYDTWACFTDA